MMRKTERGRKKRDKVRKRGKFDLMMRRDSERMPVKVRLCSHGVMSMAVNVDDGI